MPKNPLLSLKVFTKQRNLKGKLYYNAETWEVTNSKGELVAIVSPATMKRFRNLGKNKK